jgi:VanZ family protein
MFRIVAWSGVAAIVVLSLLPGHDRPHLVEVSQFEHVGAYGAAGVALALGYTQLRSHVMIGLCLMALAGALELGQLWVPGRNARVIDWAAGSLGAWAGIALVLALFWLQARWRTRGSAMVRRRDALR